MWYPHLILAGYAMGILAGAEMTTFEMSLRRDVRIQLFWDNSSGVGAKQINALGEAYEHNIFDNFTASTWNSC